MRKVNVGSNVYVTNPQRFVSDCVSITGDVRQIATRSDGQWALLSAYVAKVGGGYPIEVVFRVE